MTLQTPHARPLDSALRERLHLKEDAVASLFIVRAALQGIDSLSRVLAGRTFFALRQSEALLQQLEGLTGYDLVRALLQRDGGTAITPNGLENVPATGPVIIASTHPTGMFDFLAHAGALMDKRPDLKVVANQETEKFLGPEIIVPVRIDKENRATSAAETRRAMMAHLEADGALLIFGSGRVPNRRNGQLIEPEWRSGTTRLSESSGAPVVPAALDAQNSRYYYRIRTLAQKLSGGNDNFGAMIGSLRYTAEFIDKLGGQYDVFYDTPLDAGTDPAVIKARAEGLVPGLYAGN